METVEIKTGPFENVKKFFFSKITYFEGEEGVVSCNAITYKSSLVLCRYCKDDIFLLF